MSSIARAASPSIHAGCGTVAVPMDIPPLEVKESVDKIVEDVSTSFFEKAGFTDASAYVIDESRFTPIEFAKLAAEYSKFTLSPGKSFTIYSISPSLILKFCQDNASGKHYESALLVINAILFLAGRQAMAITAKDAYNNRLLESGIDMETWSMTFSNVFINPFSIVCGPSPLVSDSEAFLYLCANAKSDKIILDPKQMLIVLKADDEAYVPLIKSLASKGTPQENLKLFNEALKQSITQIQLAYLQTIRACTQKIGDMSAESVDAFKKFSMPIIGTTFSISLANSVEEPGCAAIYELGKLTLVPDPGTHFEFNIQRREKMAVSTSLAEETPSASFTLFEYASYLKERLGEEIRIDKPIMLTEVPLLLMLKLFSLPKMAQAFTVLQEFNFMGFGITKHLGVETATVQCLPEKKAILLLPSKELPIAFEMGPAMVTINNEVISSFRHTLKRYSIDKEVKDEHYLFYFFQNQKVKFPITEKRSITLLASKECEGKKIKNTRYVSIINNIDSLISNQITLVPFIEDCKNEKDLNSITFSHHNVIKGKESYYEITLTPPIGKRLSIVFRNILKV